ncbi:MAG TPA: hypothetical protein VH724_06945 [Candidatus Angelobacter sp.]|nr:hypothetical protein [Candidatus Angelobacter sp.]
MKVIEMKTNVALDVIIKNLCRLWGDEIKKWRKNKKILLLEREQTTGDFAPRRERFVILSEIRTKQSGAIV